MEWTCNSPSMIDYQSQWKNPEAQIPETVKLLKINVEHDLECSLETVESPQQTLFDYPRIHMFNNRLFLGEDIGGANLDHSQRIHRRRLYNM